MLVAMRILTSLLFVLGTLVFIRITSENEKLTAEIKRLETEVGRLVITDPNRVYIAEIDTPKIPPEIEPYLIRTWQFRCYFPANYDFVRFNADGRVMKDRLFVNGGSGSSWSSPKKDPIHKILTISCQIKGNSVLGFYSFDGSSGTTTWHSHTSDGLDAVVVQKLVSKEKGARSFDVNMALPILKILNSKSSEVQTVGQNQVTTFNGSLFLIYPKSRESELYPFLHGQTPLENPPDWIAKAETDE